MSVTTAVKRGYATRGWRFVEVVGRLTTDALPGANFSSATSRKITASARTRGVAIKKVYGQRGPCF